MSIEPYLFFEGRCAEAIEFYRGALSAEVLFVMTNAESFVGWDELANPNIPTRTMNHRPLPIPIHGCWDSLRSSQPTSLTRPTGYCQFWRGDLRRFSKNRPCESKLVFEVAT